MSSMKTCLVLALSLAVAVSEPGWPAAGGSSASSAGRHLRATPAEVVAKMLSMARVGPGDVVYDLGSGDGALSSLPPCAISAPRGASASKYPQRLREANDNARSAGVTDRVQFRDEDLFAADLSEATVVTM